MKLGQVIADMQGTNLASAVLMNSPRFKGYLVRNILEWRLADRELTGGGTAAGAGPYDRGLIDLWFSRCCKPNRYSNKLLIVMGESLMDDGWYPAGYMYDGRRVGFCEVRAAKINIPG